MMDTDPIVRLTASFMAARVVFEITVSAATRILRADAFIRGCITILYL